MLFVLYCALALFGVSWVVALLVYGGLRLARRRPRRYWRRALLVHCVLTPVYALVAGPAFFGWFGSRMLGTRGDERAYAGPRIAADGTWALQSRETLAAEKRGARTPTAEERASEAAAKVELTADDGVPLRAYFVEPKSGPARANVLLVHGLFRGGLELEAPAAIFRDLGCATLQLEMRNHGASGRTRPTYGFEERRDVLAAVRWLRSDPERARRPLVLFAVSLGTAATLRATPDVQDLAGLVLDAPVDDLLATAHRMLGQEARPPRRGLGLWRPYRSLTISAVELMCGFSFGDVRPIDDAARLDPRTAVLVVAAGDDARTPPATAEALFARLPAPPERKTLWIRPGSDHGQVWIDDPAGYRARLAALLATVAGAPASAPARR